MKTHCINGHEYDTKNTYIPPDGNAQCRICRAAAVKRSMAKPAVAEKRRANRSAYAARPDVKRRVRLRKYKCTVAEFERMYIEQGGLCAICRERPANTVDHDHASGEVRSLLCGQCNSGIGLFWENPAWLLAAAEYLSTVTGQ